MAKWAITYNGFGTEGASAAYQWSHINVNNQSSEPVMGEDQVSVESVRHTIRGTALISANTDTAFRSVMLNARERLTQPLKSAAANSLRIYLDYSSGSGTNEVAAGTISVDDNPGIDAEHDSLNIEQFQSGVRNVVYYGSEEDDYGVPGCSFDLSEITGTRTAVVSFTITWHKLEPPAEGVDWQVLHHSWTQSFEINESGMTTMTIEGDLKVRHFMDGQQNYQTDALGTNPDRYRRLVMPIVPANFRVQNMNWATDRSGNRLIYRVVLQEHARGLPFPAKSGSGRFTYHRAHGNAFMGIKVFDAELEGDIKSDPRLLLNTLIRVAATRIMFGGSSTPGLPGQSEPGSQPVDRVTSITVTEHDIFSKKRIGLRIAAQGLQTTSPTGQSNDPNGPMGLGFDLSKKFFDESDGLTNSERPNVYGTGLIQSIKKQMFIPWNPEDESSWTVDDLPKALWRTAYEWEGEDTVLVLEDDQMEESDSTPPPEGQGDNANSDIEGTGHAIAPYTYVSGSEKLTVKNNIVVMSDGMSEFYGGTDSVVQIGSPVVTIESEYQMTRIKEPPKRLMLSKPVNGVILSESFDINRGAIDANNNNTYVAVYRRVVRLLDNRDGTRFYDQTISVGGFNIQFRRWWPSDGLAAPADPRIENGDGFGELDRTIFVFEGSDDPNTPGWSLGDTPPIYGDS